jgi:hypothetical protein
MDTLYRMEELSDVFVDACLRDAAGRLLFVSCYGRDTSIQQLFSAFTLPASQGGFDCFHLAGPDRRRHPVEVGEADRLEKLTGRLPRDNLFGNLTHAWIYDPRLCQADYANRVVWLVDRKNGLQGSQLEQRIWDLYRQLSPVPLLDHWKRPLMDVTRGESVSALDEASTFVPLGDIGAYRIQLQDGFLDTVSTLVQTGALTLS